jgi:acetoin utilization deacetylase AcuC-like enzyme
VAALPPPEREESAGGGFAATEAGKASSLPPVSLEIPVVWSDRCLLHEPGAEVWIGLPLPGDEVPERAVRIRETLVDAGASLVAAEEHEDEPVLAVHDRGLVDFLRSAWTDWVAAGFPDDPGQQRVVPYIFRHEGLHGAVAPTVPAAPSARTGFYAFDTMTPVGPGTWDAARGAVDAALTACDLVLGGVPVAYACTRPPGHHVSAGAYGGSCYLNSAAVAAQYLCDNGLATVALVDVDAHHGNGAQAIFWERADIFTASVHVDPAAGWFPHFLGHASETGSREGEGANLNVPVASGATDWLRAVRSVVEAVHADALVVALGVDAAAADPNSPLDVTADGFRAAGRLLGALALPTVVVQEGGYDLPTLGPLVLAALAGLEEGRTR